MIHHFVRFCFYFGALSLFFACALTPARKPAEIPPEVLPPQRPETAAVERPAEVPADVPADVPAEIPASERPPAPPPQRPDLAAERPERIEPGRQAPERPEVPAIPEYIMGRGLAGADHLANFLRTSNPAAEEGFAEVLAAIYVEEAAFEGVNHDVAFAQMCLETGFLRYGGLVTPDMNNFCGLGALGPSQPGERFPDPRTGVRAHIQHLKGYASGEPLQRELVDPRYRWIRYGSVPVIEGLAGTWASDQEYAKKINGILRRLYRFSF